MGQSLLSSGSIRTLWSTDRPAFEQHLLRLDTESRYNRFGMGASDEFLRRYAAGAFERDSLVFGYFVNGELRGAAELRLIDGGEAEAAFSVEPEFRGHGVGSALLARLVVSARNRRIRRLHMVCLAHNRAMQALARKFEADLVFERTDVFGVVSPPDATSGSYVQEALAEATGFATAVLDVQRRWFQLRPWRA